MVHQGRNDVSGSGKNQNRTGQKPPQSAPGGRDVHMDGVDFFRTFVSRTSRRMLTPGNFSYCIMLTRGELDLEIDFPDVSLIHLHAGDVVAVSGLVGHNFRARSGGRVIARFERHTMTDSMPNAEAELIVGVVPNEELALGSLMVGPILIRPGEYPDLSRQVWRAAEMLEEEYAAVPSPDRTLVVRRLAEIMLINMTRRIMRDRAMHGSAPIGTGVERQLMHALDAFFEAPGRRWDLPSLAKAAGMSRTRFAETFKLVTGQTPARVLTRLRLTAVARQLANEDISVEAAAEAAGYSSAATFVRAFQREHGETPARWRRRVREHRSS